MKKYIVKNCPAKYRNSCRNPKIDKKYCKDCTDCFLKSIFEKCKKESYFSNIGFTSSEFADDILQLFDIQEVD